MPSTAFSPTARSSASTSCPSSNSRNWKKIRPLTVRSEPPCVSMRLHQPCEVETAACLRMAARKDSHLSADVHAVGDLGRGNTGEHAVVTSLGVEFGVPLGSKGKTGAGVESGLIDRVRRQNGFPL